MSSVAAPGSPSTHPATLPPQPAEQKESELRQRTAKASSSKLPKTQKPKTPKARSFNVRHLKEAFDAIIIGSGPGSLTTAGLLAKIGWKVLVLEQHSVPGGSMHTYKDKHGIEWASGLHYLGKAFNDPKSGIHKLLASICAYLPEFVSSGGEGQPYDQFIFENEDEKVVHPVRAGRSKRKEDLIKEFPEEKEAIEKYFSAIDASQRTAGPFFVSSILRRYMCCLARPFERCFSKRFHHWSDQTTDEFLNTVTANTKLKAHLAYCYGNSTDAPSRGSFAVHAAVEKHYEEGSVYPKDGPRALAESMVGYIMQKDGSKVLTNANVTEILVNDKGVATGVKVSSKSSKEPISIYAQQVISGVGAIQTNRLLPEAYQRPKSDFPNPSTGHLTLCISFKNPEWADAPFANTWIAPTPDYEANIKAFEADPFNPKIPFPMAFVNFPSAKKKECHPDGTQTCEVVIPFPYESLEKFAEEPVGKRSEEYQKIKLGLQNRILDMLKRNFPQVTKDPGLKCEMGTPLSTAHYLGSAGGSSYGASTTPGRFRGNTCRTITHIKNLTQTGQDGSMLGIAGAIVTGLLAAITVSPRVIWDNRKVILKL